jgi:hypothetical protein
VRDPSGHWFDRPETVVVPVAPEAYRQNPSYLFGVDLYNHAYWWESHELWEGVWHTTDKTGAYGQFLQGLIQISAAFIKWYLQQPEGLIKLYEIGIGRLKSVEQTHKTFMGVDLSHHVAQLTAHFDPVMAVKSPQIPKCWPDPLQNYPFLVLA